MGRGEGEEGEGECKCMCTYSLPQIVVVCFPLREVITDVALITLITVAVVT